MEFKFFNTVQDGKKVLSRLIAIELLLVLVYVTVHIWWSDLRWGPVSTLFNLDSDLSIPAWFSTIQLFFTGCLFFVASRNNQRKNHLPSSFLTAGCLFFLFLSADEGARIHEQITHLAIRQEWNWMLFDGNRGAWITLYSILALIMAAAGFRYFLRMWRYFRHESLIALSGIFIFVTGAVGCELISYPFLSPETTPVLYRVEVAFEEFFEMAGVTLFLYATLILTLHISSSDELKPGRKDLVRLQRKEHPELSIENAGKPVEIKRRSSSSRRG